AGALERQTATAEILRTISASQGDVEHVFEAIIGSSVQLCGASMGGVFRFDGEWIHLVAQHNNTLAGEAATRETFPMRPPRDSRTARVIVEGDVVHVADVEADPDYRMHDAAHAVGLRGFLGVPLVRDGKPIGVIAVGRQAPGPFTDAQVESLRSFAD